MKKTIIPKIIKLPSLSVDKSKCNGCGRCIKNCPTQILMLSDKKCSFNKRYNQFLCLNCQNCVAVCNQNAIKIKGTYRIKEGLWKNYKLYHQEPIPPIFFSKMETGTEENSITNIEKLIYKRRSTRLYKNKQVERELIERVLESGRFAPSAGNNQPWKFIVIQNRKIINQINERCKSSLKIYSKLFVPRNWQRKKINYNKKAYFSWWQKLCIPIFAKIKPGEIDIRVRCGINAVTSDPDYNIFFNAPTVIIQLADKRAIGGVDYDSGICAQNMVLTAHALGLGTCYVGLIDALKMYKKFMKEILEIEDPFEIVMALTIGYPEGHIDSIVSRERPRIKWIS